MKKYLLENSALHNDYECLSSTTFKLNTDLAGLRDVIKIRHID